MLPFIVAILVGLVIYWIPRVDWKWLLLWPKEEGIDGRGDQGYGSGGGTDDVE